MIETALLAHASKQRVWDGKMISAISAARVLESLEQAAESGDPAPAVYARIFAHSPEMEALFWRDHDASIRGHMMQEMINALIDYLGSNSYGANLFKIEQTNHSQLGVPEHIYPQAFIALRDAIEALLGERWDEGTSAAWAELLTDLDKLLRT